MGASLPAEVVAPVSEVRLELLVSCEDGLAPGREVLSLCSDVAVAGREAADDCPAAEMGAGCTSFPNCRALGIWVPADRLAAEVGGGGRPEVVARVGRTAVVTDVAVTLGWEEETGVCDSAFSFFLDSRDGERSE